MGQAATSRTATLDRGGSQAKLMPQTVALMHLVFSERETRHSHPAQDLRCGQQAVAIFFCLHVD